MLMNMLITITTGCPSDRALEVRALMFTQGDLNRMCIEDTDKFVRLARSAWRAIECMDQAVA